LNIIKLYKLTNVIAGESQLANPFISRCNTNYRFLKVLEGLKLKFEKYFVNQ
jgi:hypothetical protein